MALTAASIKAKADSLNGKLAGKRFLGGDKPSAEDVKEFEAMLGASNIALARWVKHMASFSAQERSQWGAPVKPAKAPAAAAAKPAAAAKAAPAAKAAAKHVDAKPAAAADDDDDDVDLFGGPSEEEKEALAKKKVAEEKAKQDKKKAALTAKSSILLDIKPWDDTIDLELLATKIKAVTKEGLLWGAHKLVPVAYGVKKLQLLMVIHDEMVSSDDIEDIIASFEDEVQSQDIVAWNKI